MERIAWITEQGCIYWSDLIRLLAVFGALFCFLSLYLRKGNLWGAALFVLLSATASVMLSRAAHWYFRPEQYESLMTALSDLGHGEFALMGAFVGCLLASVFVRLVGVDKNLPRLLDSMSLAGSFGIGLGRLSSFFDVSDRGMVLPAESILAGPVMDPVTGDFQWRLNTFALQAAAAGFLFLILLAQHLAGEKREGRKDGETAALFALCYGAVQVVLDSTRYDALMLRSNGFIHVVQLLSAGIMLVAVLVFAVGMVRAGGWKRWHPMLWLLQTACFGMAGYMEYYVQRHGDRWAAAYGLMTGALLVLVMLTLLTRYIAGREEHRHRQWLLQLRLEEGKAPDGPGA